MLAVVIYRIICGLVFFFLVPLVLIKSNVELYDEFLILNKYFNFKFKDKHLDPKLTSKGKGK